MLFCNNMGKRKLHKSLLVGILIFVGIFVACELLLRFVWGFANAPLYRVSEQYEYINLPNQDGTRFGQHYHYNSYSQRSEEPDTTRRKVLGLGDSVLNGGVISDQDSIATSIFSKKTGIQMLNISAGSWGPDNCAAYLEENGLFDASLIYLLVSSHDAHDVMTHEPIVGVHKSYPDKQYPLAIAELVDRYLIPKFLHTHTCGWRT